MATKLLLPDRSIIYCTSVDDLKLLQDQPDSQLEILLQTVDMFSVDVGLSFGLDKCAKLSVTWPIWFNDTVTRC